MNTPLFFANIGMPELIIIVFVILLLFGPKRIPELMRSIGKGVSTFKKGMNEIEEEISNLDDDIKDDP